MLFAVALSSCVNMNPDGTLKNQWGGVLAYERWPDGHVKYAADLTQSFAAGATVVDNFLKALTAAWVAVDIARVNAVTQQMHDAGLTKQEITRINSQAKIEALRIQAANPLP
jgi:hypothetical protein